MMRYPGSTVTIGVLALLVGLGGSTPGALAGGGACTVCFACPDGLTACFPGGTPVSACLDLGCEASDTSDECGMGFGDGCPTSEVGQCDDGINNDAWVNDLTDCDDPACATDPVCLVGVVVTVPFDLNLGDQYRLLFVTSSVTDATSADIADYNAVVAADAAAVPELDALGTTFTAVASTLTVDALDNTMTDPSPPGDTGVPIYLVNGVRFADDYDSLWTSDGPLVGGVPIPDGSLPFIPTSSGDSPILRVWTGSSQLGVEHGASGGLGDPDDFARVGAARDANYLFPSFNWMTFAICPLATERPLYGMSEVLTVCIENITQGTFPATIQSALDAAVSGDVIELSACTFFEDNIVFPNGVDVTLRGAGRDLTIIDGGGGTDTNPVLRIVDTGQTSATVISDLTIRNGITTSFTGGAAWLRDTSPQFVDVNFLDNGGPSISTGAAHVLAIGASASPLFNRCIFAGGFDAYDAFVAADKATVMLLQCLAANNTTHEVLRLEGGPHSVINCTVSATGTKSNQAVSTDSATVDAINSVFVGILDTSSSGVINTTRCLYAGATGDNIDGVPTFVNAADGDYRLAAGSLGIDAADFDTYVNGGGGAMDLNGDPRRHDDVDTANTGFGLFDYVDMGAYEFQGPDSDGDGVGDAFDNCPDDANADQLDSDGPDPALSPVAAWHFDENSGVTATDEVAGHDGTLNTVGWNASGYRGSALEFPPGGSTVSVLASTDFDITHHLTIALWVKPSAFPVSKHRLVSRSNYLFRLRGQKPQLFVKQGGAFTQSRAAVSINANEWTHLAAVWDGLGDGLLRIYVNGSEVPDYETQATVAAPLDSFSTGVTLGNDGTERYEGLMDELVIYDHALSDVEILELFNFGIGDGAGDACDNCPAIANFNDDCANALLVGEGVTEFCNEDATDDGPPDCQPGNMSRDIWFRYIGKGTGTLIIDTCAEADFDTIMAVYTGACGALTLEGCDDDGCPFEGQSRITDLPITAGQELLIRVGGYAPDRGFGLLTVDFCQDGEFDLDDYRNFAACLFGPYGELGKGCDCFDFDNDGDVTLRDFAELQMNFIAAP